MGHFADPEGLVERYAVHDMHLSSIKLQWVFFHGGSYAIF